MNPEGWSSVRSIYQEGIETGHATFESTEADGIWTIQASVFPENQASLKLHLAYGYVIVGRRQRIARMTHGPFTGTWRDTILIEHRSLNL